MIAEDRLRRISKNITEATTADPDIRPVLREIAADLDQAGVTVRDRASESWTPETFDLDVRRFGERVAAALAAENTSRRDILEVLGFVLRNRLQTVTSRARDARHIAGLRAAVKTPGADARIQEMRARIAAARERLALLHSSPERVDAADVAWLLGEIDRMHTFEEGIGCALSQHSGSGALIDAAQAVWALDDARLAAAAEGQPRQVEPAA
jgi:hypothetical protein